MRKTTKKALSLFLSLVLVVSLLSISSFAANEDKLTFTVNQTNDGYIVSKCNTKTTGVVDIPNVYNDLPVTEIANDAFVNCKKVTEITIPNTIVNIGQRTFKSCVELKQIEIPDSVKSIGRNAFYGCSKLNYISLGEGITDIKDYTFYGCSGLTSIKLSQNLTNIDSFAFGNSTSLRSVYFPDSLINIGRSAFAGCSNLHSATFGLNLETIEGSAFENSGLTEVKISNKTTSIGTEAFSNCTKLEKVVIGTNLKTIETGAFRNCTALTYVEYNNVVEDVKEEAFVGCESLQHILINKDEIPDTSKFLSFGTDDVVEYNCSPMFIGTGSTVTVTPPESNSYTCTFVVMNDTNGDGVSDVLDAAYAILCVNGLRTPTEYEKLAMDNNFDEEINILDYQSLVNYILQK